jgi:hypothetical protein
VTTNKIIPYNQKLKKLARQLRNNRTFSEIDVKKSMNDVLRFLESVISDIEINKGLTSP